MDQKNRSPPHQNPARGVRLWIEGSDWSRSDSLSLWVHFLLLLLLLLLLLQWFQSQDSGVTPNSSPSPTRRFRYTSKQKALPQVVFPTLSFWTHVCLLSCRPAVSATVRWPALTPLKRKGNQIYWTRHELKHNRDMSCWRVWSVFFYNIHSPFSSASKFPSTIL